MEPHLSNIHDNYRQPFAESIILTCLTLVLLTLSTSSILFFSYYLIDLPMQSEPPPLMLAIAVFFGLLISYLLVIRFSLPFLRNVFIPELKAPLAWLILALLSGLLFSLLVLTIAQYFTPPSGIDSTFEQIVSGGTLAKVLLFMAVVFFAPIGEEYLFRGILFSGLQQKVSTFWAISLSSVVFMSFHLLEYYGYWFALLAIFLLGALLGILRLRSQSMLVPILCHASYNLIMLTLA